MGEIRRLPKLSSLSVARTAGMLLVCFGLGMTSARAQNQVQAQAQASASPVAQRVTVTGRVTGPDAQPLAGASVALRNSAIGTVADQNGRFSLQVPKADDITVIVSYVGMKTVPVRYLGNALEVKMAYDETNVGEVVVMGYQNVDRRHLTSSVSSVKMADIEVAGMTSLDQMLEGRIPGLMVLQNTGQVGSAPKLRIRGTSSVLGNQEPLWVVDGIIQTDPVNVDPQQLNDLDFVNLLGNAISGLNPDDIERIDVLKDASATALYGSRAANGVIVVTTKQGEMGAPKVNYTFNGTFMPRPRYTDRNYYMMNSKQRVAVSKEMMDRGAGFSGYGEFIGYERAYVDYYVDGNISFDEFQRQSQYYETMNTDWLGYLTRDAFSPSHSLSLSGGAENIKYYASLGHSNENGNVKGENSERYTGSMRINVNYKKISAQIQASGSLTDKTYTPSEVNVMNYATKMNRAIPLYEDDGDLWYYRRGGYDYNVLNEMANSELAIDQRATALSAQVNYKVNENFRLQGTGSMNYGDTDQGTWYGAKSYYAAKLRKTNYGTKAGSESLLPFGGELKESNTSTKGYTLRLQADYNKYFGENRAHFFNGMIGYEMSSADYNGYGLTSRGYYRDRGDGFAKLNNTTDYPQYTTWKLNNNPTFTENLSNMMSVYSTLTYSFKDRYIFNVNGRADWSNAFGDRSNEKLFPIWSTSARWNMHSDVLKNVKWIDNLALKFSYGLQGNSNNSQPARTIINLGDYNNDYDSYLSTIDAFANPDLRWEKTSSTNVGVDFSILGNKIRGSVDVWYKKLTDGFLGVRVAPENGVSSYTINEGTLINKGVDVTISFTAIDRGASGGKQGFVWRFDPQLGQALNQLVNRSMNQNNRSLQDKLVIDDLLTGRAQLSGVPLNTFYSYRFAGLDNKGYPTFGGLGAASDLAYDNNGNAIMKTDGTQYTISEYYNQLSVAGKNTDVWFSILERSGNRVPVIQGGFNNYFAYRNFSLSFNFSYSIGNKIRLLKLYSWDDSYTAPSPHDNLRREFVNRWRFEGDENFTNIPALRPYIPENEKVQFNGWWRTNASSGATWAPSNSVNTYMMYDNSSARVVSGNYLRLQSLTLRYNFNKKLLSHVGLSRAYLSFSGSNLFTLCHSDLKGQDPGQSGSSEVVNISNRPRYTFSANINF